MELDLESSIAQLPQDFLAAVSEDEDARVAFLHHMEDVLLRAQSAGSQHLIDSACEASRFILAEARNMQCFGFSSRDVVESYTGPLSEPEEERIEEADPHTQALHDWFVDNIMHPFPTVQDMQRLAVACCAAGLIDSDTVSVDAWFLRQRQVSGWNRIADKYCGGNLDDMRLLCASLLSRTREECAEDETLDKEAVEDVFDMCDEVSFACGRLDCEISPWVEALEGRFEEMEEDDDEPSEVEEAILDLYDTDSTISMDDQDEDMTDEPVSSVSWSPVLKRKREELDNELPPRSLRRAVSTSSSDSSYSTASFSSFSGSSASSDTSVEDDCDDDLRPTKRQRNVSDAPEPAPSALLSSPEAVADVSSTLPEAMGYDENFGDTLLETCDHTPTPEQCAELWSMRKRKHEDFEDDDASQTVKRPRFSLENTRVPPLPQGTAVAVGATGRLDWNAKSIRTAARSFEDSILDLDLVAATSWPLVVDQDLINFMKWVDSECTSRDAPFAGSHIANACAALDGELPSKEDEEKILARPVSATNVTVSFNSIDTVTLQSYIGVQRQFDAPVEAWRAALRPATELHSMFRAGPPAPTAAAYVVSRPLVQRSPSPARWSASPPSLFKRASSPASTDGRSTPSLVSDDSFSDSEDEFALASPRMSDVSIEDDTDMEDEVTVFSDTETDDEMVAGADSSQVDRKQRISNAIESIMLRKAQQHKRAAAVQQLQAIRAFLPSSYTATLGAPLPAPVISAPATMQVADPFMPSSYKAVLGAPLPVAVPPTPPVRQSQLSTAALAVLREKVAQAKIRRTAHSS